MRCNECNRFATFEQESIDDLDNLELQAPATEHEGAVIPFLFSGEVTLNLNCQECGATLLSTTSDVTGILHEVEGSEGDAECDHKWDDGEASVEASEKEGRVPTGKGKATKKVTVYGVEGSVTFKCEKCSRTLEGDVLMEYVPTSAMEEQQ